MVKCNSDSPLDRTFAALADPTRRSMLARLAEQPDISVSALAAPFSVSLPAIMKHLDVLSDAGLVTRTKSGRTVTCRLNAAPMHNAIAWLNRYERFWSEALSRLADFLEERSLMSVETAVKPSLTHQATPQSVPSPSLRRLDRPGKNKALDGTGEIVTVRAESDPRKGGRYLILMRSPNGEPHDVGGVYREVIANEKLVFTWAWHSTPEREIAGDGAAQAGRRRYVAHPDARAVRRRGDARRP